MRTANTEIRECVSKWSLTKEMRAERVGKEEGREGMGARHRARHIFFFLLLLSFYLRVNDPSSSKFLLTNI